jgi:hypothetical protein
VSEPESNREAFARGEVSGKVDARLGDHDDHFHRINGSIDRMASAAELQAAAIQALVLVVQRLTDKMDASETRVIATAKALKEADEARRDKTDQSWSPLARWSLAVGIIAALIAIFYAVIKGG